MAQILTANEIAKINFKTQRAREMRVYRNHGDSIMKANNEDEIRNINDRPVRLIIAKENPGLYVGSAAEAELKTKIEDCIKACKKKGVSIKTNITHYPAGAENLFDYLRLDITARILDMQDITSVIANVIQRDDFTDPTNVQWLYEYVAVFKEFKGRGDPVNLVQIKTGDKDSFYFTFYGVGFEQDLYNQLFNNIFDAMKVTKAVAKGYILRKNSLVLNPILNFNYPAPKTIAPVTGSTYEENIYDTLQNALTALGQLMDFQTQENVDVMQGVTLMIHTTRVRHVNRAINGGLMPGVQVKNLNPIQEITRILPNQARRQVYGNETVTYQGCGLNQFFLFVPQMYFWIPIKRDLTHVTGEGDTFGITSDREAWYFVASRYSDQFFGGDTTSPTNQVNHPNTLCQNTGWIVTGELPDPVESEDT